MLDKMMFRCFLTMSACVCFCAVSGCGAGSDAPTRIDLTGSATFDGQPIATGEIMFIPDSRKGNKGPAGSAVIKDGTYTTAVGGTGVVGGPHTVRVVAFDGKSDPEAELPFGKPLFPEYEMNADLPAASGSEPQKFDIAVPKEALNPKKVNPADQV